MARMLGKSGSLRTCPYGCCSEAGNNHTHKKFLRRLARRRERQSTRRFFGLATDE